MTELQSDLRGSSTPAESIFAARTSSGDKLASWEKCGNSRATLRVRAHQISPRLRSTRARGREGRSERHTWHHDGGGRAGNRPGDRLQVHPSMWRGGAVQLPIDAAAGPSWSGGGGSSSSSSPPRRRRSSRKRRSVPLAAYPSHDSGGRKPQRARASRAKPSKPPHSARERSFLRLRSPKRAQCKCCSTTA